MGNLDRAIPSPACFGDAYRFPASKKWRCHPKTAFPRAAAAACVYLLLSLFAWPAVCASVLHARRVAPALRRADLLVFLLLDSTSAADFVYLLSQRHGVTT